MASKQRKWGDEQTKHRPEHIVDLPDRRAMEGAMQKMIAGLPGQGEQDTPLGKAQAVMYRAFEERDERRRVQLAKEALEICADCADAYVLQAEHARRRKEVLHLFEQGVAAGERALGKEAFQQDVGHFWGVLKTRPYMRARQGLAVSLWSAGRREEAVEHLQDMLRLNPNDNQGVRYTLAGFLLFFDRDDDLARLLQQFPDEGSATWTYSKAILAFRRHGDTPGARRLLKEALKTNKHVPAFLLGEEFPPLGPPSHYSPGDENEALIYVNNFLVGWKGTPGGIAWLRGNVKRPKKEKARPQPKGPLGFIKAWLNKNLPQRDDVWQADFRQLHNWIRIDDEGMMRLWIVLVTSRSNELVLAHDMPEEKPSAAVLWDALVNAMQHPEAGKPHRPTELQVRPDELWQSLKPHLDEIGVALTVTGDVDQIEGLLGDLCGEICGKPKPGLLDMPGITPAQAGGFFEAAAFFFQQAPWKKLGYEAAIKIECNKFKSGPWYAVMMGQTGLLTGFALYDDLTALRRTWQADDDDLDDVRECVATSVTYGEEWTIPVADLEAAKKYGWQVARSDAYPVILHKERGTSVRPPLAWELELIEGCLRAIPEFVNRHKQGDPAGEAMTAQVASGPLTLVLSWVADE